MEKCRVIFSSQIQEVAKAMTSDLRLKILEEVSYSQKSITQLVNTLGVAQPTISINVQMLEAAGLVRTLLGSGREKMIIRTYDSLLFHLPISEKSSSENSVEISMPIGLYNNCKLSSPCGVISKEGVIGLMDDPRAFYLPERVSAALLYFSEEGFLEYHLPNPIDSNEELTGFSFSAELCSEAPGFQQYYPSDITLFINGKEIGTWTSPGDYGDQKGKNTPEWWNLGNSQYGDLTIWNIDEDGSYLNGSKCSDITINEIIPSLTEPIVARLEVKRDAKNRKGLNLFGEGFGNYSQHIKVVYEKK